MIGRLATPARCASCCNCNCAAGRCVSKDATSTRRFSRCGQPQGDLAGGGGLARALQQPDHQDRHRRSRRQVQRHRAHAAQRLDHHVVDDLDDLLAGRHAVQHLDAGRALPAFGNEILDHRQGDVRLQQRQADLAQAPRRCPSRTAGPCAAARRRPRSACPTMCRTSITPLRPGRCALSRATTTNAPLREHRGAAAPQMGQGASAPGRGHYALAPPASRFTRRAHPLYWQGTMKPEFVWCCARSSA